MTAKITHNNCVLCIAAVALAVASGFSYATATETSGSTSSARVVRSPQSSIADAILGANLQLFGQGAKSTSSVLESKMNAAKAMVDASSDVIAAKLNAVRDMAGVAINGGKAITGTALGTLGDTADGLAVFLGFPALEPGSRKRRSPVENDDDDKEDDMVDDDNDDDYRGRGYKGKRIIKKEDLYEKKKGKSRVKRSEHDVMGFGGPDGLGKVSSAEQFCAGCSINGAMSRTIALKGGIGGAIGAGVIKGGGTGGMGRAVGATGAGGRAGVGAGLVGSIGAAAGGGLMAGSSIGNEGRGKVVGVGGVIGGGVGGVLGRKRREARRFGGGRSRFTPARGGGSKKGSSDSSGQDSSGTSGSAKIRQKRTIIQHVIQYLRRKRQDDNSADSGANGKGNGGGKSYCHSFHSPEEDEEERKFWENFHNMMDSHDEDWDFDFEAEICGDKEGSTEAAEGAREATTPLPPTIDS